VNMLDDYHAASIDFSNAFAEPTVPTPLKVAAVATCADPTPSPAAAPEELSILRARLADCEAYMRISSSLPGAHPSSRAHGPPRVAAYAFQPSQANAFKPRATYANHSPVHHHFPRTAHPHACNRPSPTHVAQLHFPRLPFATPTTHPG
jgi:hypothetical protein